MEWRLHRLSYLYPNAEMVRQIDRRSPWPDHIEVAFYLRMLRASISAFLVPPKHIVQPLRFLAIRDMIVSRRIGWSAVCLGRTKKPGPKISKPKLPQCAAIAKRNRAQILSTLYVHAVHVQVSHQDGVPLALGRPELDHFG